MIGNSYTMVADLEQGACLAPKQPGAESCEERWVMTMCGSFSPMHVGHVCAALDACEAWERRKSAHGGVVRVVGLVFSPVNDQYVCKAGPLLPGTLRLGMCTQTLLDVEKALAYVSEHIEEDSGRKMRTPRLVQSMEELVGLGVPNDDNNDDDDALCVRLFVSPWEIEQTDYMRTYRVLQQQRDHLAALSTGAGEQDDTQRRSQNDHVGQRPRIALLCGSDMLASMNSPTSYWTDESVSQMMDVLDGVAVVSRVEGSAENEITPMLEEGRVTRIPRYMEKVSYCIPAPGAASPHGARILRSLIEGPIQESHLKRARMLLFEMVGQNAKSETADEATGSQWTIPPSIAVAAISSTMVRESLEGNTAAWKTIITRSAVPLFASHYGIV